MSHTDFATRAKIIALALVVCACMSHSTFGQTPKPADKGPAAFLAGKERVTILITDSGLGGLSVVSQIENRLQQCHCVSQIRLIFANALPDNEHPYNRMASGSEKAKAFSAALDGFMQRFHPDIILVACNTLSVVYPETEFATRMPVPVFGIVEIGSGLISEYLAIHPDGDVIILGTPTTAESNAHRSALEQDGIESHRITVQGCDQLETEIQSNPSSDLVQSIIEMYAQEALALRDSSNDGEAAIALCCTHYPYVKNAFEQAFTTLLGQPVTIIDPNAEIAASLFEGADCARNAATSSSVEVFSRARIAPADVAAIANLLKAESSATAAALQSYVYDTTLFEYRP